MADTAATTTPIMSWDDFEKQFANLRGGTAAPASTGSTNSPLSTYDPATLQSNLSSTQDALKEAETSLQGYQTKRYDEEYAKEGLGDLETSINDLDSQITAEKSKRDASLAKTQRNPFYSAATITGETEAVDEESNRNLSNLIDQRNSIAGQYNTKLGAVKDRIAQETADKQQEVENLRYDLSRYDQSMSDYRNELRTQVSNDTDEERWEAEFALNLQNAQKDKTSVSEYQADGKLYRDVFNNETGELVSHQTLGNAPASSSGTSEEERFADRISQGLEPDSGLRTAAQRLISQNVSDPTDAGYSGTTATRIEAEMSWIRSGGGSGKITGTMSEDEFRKAVRAKEQTNATPDELKTLWSDVKLDNGKSPADVIDDEWSIKTKPGFMGWLGRLIRPGV